MTGRRLMTPCAPCARAAPTWGRPSAARSAPGESRKSLLFFHNGLSKIILILRFCPKDFNLSCHQLEFKRILSSDWDWDWDWAWDWGQGLGTGDGNLRWELGMGNGNGKMVIGKWEIESTPSPRR